jgi:hypothetical protein
LLQSSTTLVCWGPKNEFKHGKIGNLNETLLYSEVSYLLEIEGAWAPGFYVVCGP